VSSRVWRWIIPLGVLVTTLLATLACTGSKVKADGFSLRRDFTLASGSQRSGDQVIVAIKDAYFEPQSMVTGKATIIGSDVVIDGEMADDVVVLADRLVVGENAHIQGDLTVCTNALVRQPGARIDGKLTEECSDGHGVSIASLFESGMDGWRENAVLRFGSMLAGALLFGAVAALVTLIFPRPLIRMSHSMRRSPGTTGGFGCLTILAALGLTMIYLISLLLVLPLVLLPFFVLAWVALGLLSLLGWIALAEPLGNVVLNWLDIDEQPRMISAAVGGVALTLAVRVWGLFWFTSWIGVVLAAILGSIGLGAVVLTRVGTRPFPRSS
jgi:hypothetical protein